MQIGRTILIAVELLAGSIWVGSLVCLALISRVARRVLDAPSRITLFRSVGRLYGIVGTGALVVAIAAGVAIAGRPAHWSGSVTASILLSVVLVAFTGAGIVQARAMTVRRQGGVDAPHEVSTENAIRRGAAMAGVLRGVMSLLTLIIVVLGAHLIAG
jgi:hypothetical protein